MYNFFNSAIIFPLTIFSQCTINIQFFSLLILLCTYKYPWFKFYSFHRFFCVTTICGLYTISVIHLVHVEKSFKFRQTLFSLSLFLAFLNETRTRFSRARFCNFKGCSQLHLEEELLCCVPN